MDESEGGPHHEASDRDIRQTPVSIERPQPTVDSPTRKYPWHKKEKIWPQRVEAVCAVLLVFITGAYTWYARGQLGLTGQSISQSKIDNANAITAQQNIAQSALTASQKNFEQSLESASDQSRLDQRAWVGLVGASLDAVEIGKPLSAHVVLFNSGKTIAKRVVPEFHVRFSPVPFDKLPPPSGPRPEYKSVGILVPGGRYDSKIGSTANSTEIDKQNVANWFTYIWGEVGYDDIFKQHHQTQFCDFRKGAEGDFNQCGFHNDAN
jgi:hypothetical protein